ncbi:MAG: mechanosensitive ion channel domain-containing protein [Gemmatimonadaceae bacterium]
MQTSLPAEVQQSVSDVGGWLAANQSRLLTAVALLGLGVVLAVLLRLLTVRVVGAIERAIPGRAFRATIPGMTRERPVADIVGSVVSWAVLLFFLATAADAMGIPLMSSVVGRVSEFVPRVFAAVLIIVIGLVVGNLARGAVAATAVGAGSSLGPGVGQLVRVAVIVSAVLIAVAELGVNAGILTAFFSVALAALLGGFALAFGLGARTAISNIIGSHYLRKSFEVGQSVRIGDVEGTIADISATAVFVEVPDGRMSIPASQFVEMRVTLLSKRDAP